MPTVLITSRPLGPLQDKQLILLHNQDHYDVITSLPGFFGSSYVCADCWKPYNTEGLHRCTKKKLCGACRQKECPDFLHAYPRHLKATQRCQSCHQDFFGDTCFDLHLGKTHAGKPVTDSQSSVCSQRRRCPTCYQQNVGLSNIERHQCKYIDCPSCHEYVHADDTFVLFKEPLKKRKERGHVKRVLAPNEVPPPRSLIPPQRRRRKPYHPFMSSLILKPCNPRNNTLPISSWPKPKTTIHPSGSQVPSVSATFWNGWIP